MNRSSVAYSRSRVVLCNKGEVSNWNGSTRFPVNPQLCQPCLGDGTYAPRLGGFVKPPLKLRTGGWITRRLYACKWA